MKIITTKDGVTLKSKDKTVTRIKTPKLPDMPIEKLAIAARNLENYLDRQNQSPQPPPDSHPPLRS